MNALQPVSLRCKGFWAVGVTVFMVACNIAYNIAYNISVIPAIMPAIVSDFHTSVDCVQSILVLFSLTTAFF